MTNPTPLSPTAQAVLDAATDTSLYVDDDNSAQVAAAALRAAANNFRSEMATALPSDFVRGVLTSANALEEIADELEANCPESPDSSSGVK